MTDKEFFKLMKRDSSEFSDDFEEAFPYWVLKIFFFNLSKDEIERAVEGLDHDDESIDASFVLDETKEIYIIQCKSAISERNIQPCKKEWLSYLFDVPNKLKNTEYINKHRNQRIKDIAAEFAIASRRKYKIKFYFFHLGNLPLKNESIIKSYNTSEYVTFEYLGFKQIKNQFLEYQSRISLTDPESFEIALTYSTNPELIQEKIGKHHTLISLITGDQLIELREQHKYMLFDKNVRFNLGKNKINSGIVDTATYDKSNFYFYNNGITINCSSFKLRNDKKSVKISHPQIINGAQTVDSIYNAFKDRVNNLSREMGDKNKARRNTLTEFLSINVLFRLIQSESHESDFALNVITFNNSQNAIQARDFFANKSEQIELQRKFNEYGYFYEIKRGERDYIKKNLHIHLNKKLSDYEYSDEKIDIEKLASLYRAFRGAPNSKEVGAKYILNDPDGAYQDLFGSSIIDVTDDKVKDMILAYNIFDLLEKESKLYKKILIVLSDLENDTSLFNKLRELINESSVFKSVLKNKFNSYETYTENKPIINNKIREYYAFSQGKYHILAIYRLIIEKCGYYQNLVNTNLFKDKDFLYNKMIKTWLPDCLDDLLIPAYKEIIQSEGISMSAFYLRPQTFNILTNHLYRLDLDKNKEFAELFPLPMF